MSHKNRILSILVLNFVFSTLLFSLYPLFSAKSALEYSFLIPAMFSMLLVLYIPLSFFSALLSKLGKKGYFLIFLLLNFFHLFTALDIIIYKLFKFHINAMVLNLIFTPGGLSTLDQNLYMLSIYTVAILGITSVSYILYRASLNLHIRRLNKLLLFLIICFFFEKGFSALAVSKDIVWVTKNFKVYPLYQPLRMRTFLEKYLSINPERGLIKEIDIKKSQLNYPQTAIIREEPARKKNIILLVADSLRFDMYEKEIMPETFKFASQNSAFVFKNHYSGGNATRFGIFSIFYGLYGSYWEKILGERKSPFLIDELLNENYILGVFASARVTYPEFDRTAFVKVPKENIFDKPNGDKVEKDKETLKNTLDFIEKNKKNPFFAFIFFDAMHGSYSYPKETEKFFGATEKVNHLFLRPENIKSSFIRYKNSAHFQDSLIKTLTAYLSKENLLKDTIVIITGDHGEPFFERGYYGHNQGYCDYEIKVPLIFYMPKKKGKEINAFTSHMDIPTTLIKILGVKNRTADFSNGLDLFDYAALKNRRFLTAFSWDTAALIKLQETTVLPLETYNLSDIIFYNEKYEQINRKKSSEDISFLREFYTESSRFYK